VTAATPAATPVCHISSRGGAPHMPESGTQNGGDARDAGHVHYNVARMPRQGAAARLDGPGKPGGAEQICDRLGLHPRRAAPCAGSPPQVRVRSARGAGGRLGRAGCDLFRRR